MCYTVYIIYSKSTDVCYKGQTDNLHDRLSRHNNGWEKSTKHGIPWELIWSTTKRDRSASGRLERKQKNLSRERLIEFIKKNS